MKDVKVEYIADQLEKNSGGGFDDPLIKYYELEYGYNEKEALSQCLYKQFTCNAMVGAF